MVEGIGRGFLRPSLQMIVIVFRSAFLEVSRLIKVNQLFLVLLFVLNLAFHIRILFSDMGNNKPTDKLVVQKVFEMHAAGDSAAKIARS